MRRLPVLVPTLLLILVACDSNPISPGEDFEGLEGAGIGANAPAANGSVVPYLVNGGMETDEGWWFLGPQGTTQGFSATTANSGLRSIALTMPTTTGEGEFSFAGQYFPISDPDGRKVILKVRMKLEGVSGQGAAIAIRGDTEDVPGGWAEAFATTQGNRSFVGTSDWTEVSVELDGIESDIRNITVYLLLLSESSGTVYFDDAELEMPDGTPIRTIRNGGFEAGNPWPLYWWRGGSDLSHFAFNWLEQGAWEGARAVSLSRQNADDDNFAFWAQTIYADDFRGGSVTLRVMIKTELVGQGVSILIRGDDTVNPSGAAETAASTEGDTPISGSQDWTEYSVTLDGVSASIRSLTVYLVYLPLTTGTVLFDGVSLTP